MKKRLIIILSILMLLFLIARPIYIYLNGFFAERKWYVEQLNIDLSGEIDSINVMKEKAGFILFHLTRGNVDSSHEDSLNTKLKHNENIRFLVVKQDDKLEIFTHTPTLYLRGDSICIDSDRNSLIIYRSGREISKSDISSHLQGY
jgi:hypothetical protein